jgi:HD-GYP domain-containing protein (c-di-GMP phosphodiesterase class II)
MSTALEGLVRQTLIVISEGHLCKKVHVPENWIYSKIQSFDQLNACADRAQSQHLRLLLVVGEDELSRSLQLLDLKKENFAEFTFGILLVSKDPKDFLKRQGLPNHVLDILSEKEAKFQLDFFLLKNLRPSMLSGNGSNKISANLLSKLNNVVTELFDEKNAEKLYEKILLKALEFGDCSAGQFRILKEEDGENYFVPSLTVESETDLIIDRRRQVVEENSICGHVVQTGKIHALFDFENVKTIRRGGYNPALDYPNIELVDSLITIPLKNSRHEVEGILQLVYRNQHGSIHQKRKTHFDFEDETLWSIFGTQVGICLENIQFYIGVHGLFEGFVKASVKAIEARDVSTGGHSERVAKMSVGLARAVTEIDAGTYRLVKFRDEEIRELEYAAMLHDFGKIGVREEILTKAKKLHGWQLRAISERLKICKAAVKIHLLEVKLKGTSLNQYQFEEAYQKRVQELDHFWQVIEAANSPTILKQESVVALEKIRQEQLVLPDGEKIALLSSEEYEALAIMQGTLTEDERLEIESHVKHTHQFLKMIPWTREFKNLTEIAYCHHEKLDGTGYPRRLVSHEIPLQSKIMTIADIFDALTARDRWYKDSVPIEKAIEILYEEVKSGKLDEALFEIFVAKKIYEQAQPNVIHQVA